MAAGLVSHNVTTASGVTFAVRSWVPDTAAPDVGCVPVHVAFDTAGAEVLTAAQVVSLLAKLDPQGFTASATFTPAASSHVAGDCNGAAQQFSFSPAPASGAVVMITDAEFEIDGATAEATAWKLYLYNVTPPSATADDGAWDLPSGDRASFLGEIDLATAVDKGSTQWVEAHGINKVVKLSGTTTFGYLVNLTTLTPANVAHKVKLYGTPV